MPMCRLLHQTTGLQMVRRDSVELENRREISALKEVLHELSTNVALNTAATENLTSTVEKEFNRHNDDRKGLTSRVNVVEARVDAIDMKLAQDVGINGRIASVETLADQLENRMNIRDGWTGGAKWVVGIALTISVPCFGWVLYSVLHKLFGMG